MSGGSPIRSVASSLLLKRVAFSLAASAAAIVCLEERSHQPPELGQLRKAAFPLEKGAAKLVFQPLNGPREGRLRHVARVGSAGKVQRLAQCHKIADLVQLHALSPIGIQLYR